MNVRERDLTGIDMNCSYKFIFFIINNNFESNFLT